MSASSWRFKSSSRYQLKVSRSAKKYINPQAIRLSGFFIVQRNALTFDILCSKFYSNLKAVTKVTEMAKESLLDITVRNAKPGDKGKRFSDGGRASQY